MTITPRLRKLVLTAHVTFSIGWAGAVAAFLPLVIVGVTSQHRGEPVVRAQQQLIDLIRDLLTEVAETGDLRDDVAPDELASYCLHALPAASSLPSKAAVHRLVTVTLAGLRPSPARPQ